MIKKTQPKKWGLFCEGRWATVPYENPLKDFITFKTKKEAEEFIEKEKGLYVDFTPKEME